MSANRRRLRASALVLALTVSGALLSGCRVSSGDDVTSVAAQVERSHRFEVDLTGPVPTRDQLGFAPGDTMQNWTARDNGLTAVYRLAGGRTLTVPAASVTVSSTQPAVTTPRHPDAPDELVLPDQVSATQDFTTRDEARQLLLDQVDTLGFDPADIDVWYRSAPAAKGPGVLLNQFGFSGRQPIGYARVGVTIIMSDLAYIIWNVSWDPPIPGYAYDSDGVPQPVES